MGVRRNAVELTPLERDNFINAVKALKATFPNNSPISLYDQFVAIHLGVTQLVGLVDGGHGNAAFLPWHREYLRHFEQALQEVDSDVSLPYWDWTDAEGSENVIFQDDFMGPNGGPGGNGGSVQSGHFAEANGWRLVSRLHVRFWGDQSFGTALRRFMLPFSSLPSQEDVNSALNTPFYASFRSTLEQSPLHNYIHGWMGGSMAFMTSPNDLIFFMHHANVDRIWVQWQDNGHAGNNFYPAGGRPYGHNLNDRMWPWDGGQSRTVPGLAELLSVLAANDIVTPADVLDYRALGYSYDIDRPIPELTIDEPAIDASISAPGEQDVFLFEVPNGGRYTIETQGRTDVVMSLFGPNNRTNLIAQDDDSGENTNARITSQLTTGTYYVVIRHYSPQGTGDYSISVRAAEGSPVPTPDPTPIIELTVGGPAVQASIGASGEVDVFQFEVPAMGRYSIQTQGPTDIVMSLFGPNNRANLVTVDDDSGEDVNAKIVSRLTAGIYYVEVRHYSPRGTGNYSISVRADEEDIPELEVNGPEVQGEIAAANESDLYMFTATEDGEYTIETSGNTDTFLTLYGPDSQTVIIAQDDDSGPSANSRITANLTAGAYYARVRHYRPTGTGAYGISVRRS